jgi:hypothetical protein
LENLDRIAIRRSDVNNLLEALQILFVRGFALSMRKDSWGQFSKLFLANPLLYHVCLEF